jgi:hypothetical protein
MLKTAKLVNRALRNSIEEAWRSLYGSQIGIPEHRTDAIHAEPRKVHVCRAEPG